MDAQTVDQNYAQLQQQGKQTAQLITTLAGKLQTAANGGDQNAREWLLDLKEITLGVQQEENQTGLLLQSIHQLVDNHVQSTQPAAPQQPAVTQAPAAPQPQNQQPQNQQRAGFGAMGGMAGGIGGGGMLHRFLGGGFGQAMATGAAFGIGDDLISHLF